jgi:Transposase protein
MSAAVAAILEGMPEPRDLRLQQVAGRCVVTAGSRVLFDYDTADTAMRNMAIAALRQLGFQGKRVAAVFGLTENYVATLHRAALREGSVALIGQPRPGRPGKLGQASWEQAAAWRAQGASDSEIGRRLGVAHTTVARRLGSGRAGTGAAGGAQPQAEPLFPGPGPEPVTGTEPAAGPGPGAEADPGAAPGTGLVPAPGAELVPAGGAELVPARGTGLAPATGAGVVPSGPAAGGAGGGPGRLVTAGARIAEGRFCSRYAGAMLLHAFAARAGAGEVLAAAAGGEPAGVALLSAVSICFALGAATIEQVKHLTAAEAGPVAGLAALPDLRTIRPKLAAIADGADPVALQRLFAAAMLAADPVVSGVYYVDDHFVPYTGAKPVGKGWNNKRGRAEKGRADTHVTAHDGRAVCFVTGEPSGLSVTLPKALAELKQAVPPGTAVMLGFDRGGAYPAVFKHCQDNNVHWVTYRRAPLAVPAMLPVITTVTIAGRRREITWAEETVQLKDYGQARQLTLFEHGTVVLQILTSDFDACPAQILAWLKSRWREENFLKYASENYGIDKICDYIATIETNTKIIENPARKKASAAVRDAETALAAAERGLAALLADPAITPAAKNTRLIPAAQEKITAARTKLDAAAAARDTIPAKLPANLIDPDAKVALLRAGRRGLQMVLRLLAHNAEHWLANQLNAYLRDDDEYRAITRQTIIRGLAGTITYTSRAITVGLQQPDEPRVARTLALLLDEINATPPTLPGDHRPITYQLTANPPAFNS